MLHFYYYRLPELQTMRSVSGDYSLRAAVHHRYTFVLRLPTRLFSAIKRTKQCLHVSPAAIENSVQILSTSAPSATAVKSHCVETVVPVEPGAVSGACAVSTGKDKFQNFVIPIRITVSDRLSSRLSTLFKSVGKYAPPGSHRLEINPLPCNQRALAAGPSDINGSSACLIEFTRENGCSNQPFSSELPDPLCDSDYPPGYTTVIPEDNQGIPGGDAVAPKVLHNMSLDQNLAKTDASDATPGNRLTEHKKQEGFPNENVDDRPTCPAGESRLYLEIAPTLTSSSLHNLGPTHEIQEVSQLPRQPVVENNFLHFYSTLKPYIIRRELAPRPVQGTPPPIDDGPLPESDGFRVLEGPFTTPAGGTNASEVKGPPCPPSPSPTSGEPLHEREPGVEHSDPCLSPTITALTDPTNHQSVSQPVAPARLSDEVLGKAMTWDIDILHARTGLSQTLNSTLRSMQNKWLILEFELAFETSDASMFRDNYGFASKPLALQPLCSSPRITELGDENEPVLRKATGEIQSCGGGANGSSSSQAQQGSGSRAYVQQSKSTKLPRGRKRANDDDDDDRGGKKKRERREEPPVDDDPPPPDSEEDEGVLCPYYVKDRQNCTKKSCISPKKNLSKLKEHLRRAHFLHLGCPFENCPFNAGDKFQITRHQKTAHAGQIRDPIPRTTDSRLLRKNEALGIRNLTWDEICDICFREEPEEPIRGFGDYFESEGEGEEEEEEEEEGGDDDDVDDGDREGQGDRDGREARGDQIEGQGEHTRNLPEASQSMLDGGASTIVDTPEPALVNDESFRFDPESSMMSDGLSQGEDLPPPSPDRDTFPGSGQPPPSSPIDGFPWGMAEEYISMKFETLRRTCFEDLRNRHGTSLRTAQQMNHVFLDIDRFFGEIGLSARAALNPANDGRGTFTHYTRDSLSFPVPSTSRVSAPLGFPMPQDLFSHFPIRGHGSTLPSLTTDSQSSHNSMPHSITPRAFYLDHTPTMASGSQPKGPGMAGSEAGGNAIYDPYGDVLAHRNPEGLWSVGDPRATQLHFDQAHS